MSSFYNLFPAPQKKTTSISDMNSHLRKTKPVDVILSSPSKKQNRRKKKTYAKSKTNTLNDQMKRQGMQLVDEKVDEGWLGRMTEPGKFVC